MIISKSIHMHTGHRIPNHKSKCQNFHGHTYVVEAGVEGIVNQISGTSDEGMIIDFGDLKRIMIEEVHDRYDHGFIMSQNDEFKPAFEIYRDVHKQNIHFVPFVPTAENLAKHFYELMEERLKNASMGLRYVKVWETPTSTANYFRKDLEEKYKRCDG